GRFTWDNELTEGKTYPFHVYERDHAPKVVELRALPPVTALPPVSQEALIELAPGKPFWGQLVDAVSDRPMAGVPVLYGVLNEARYFEWPDRDSYIDGRHGITLVQRAVTGADGGFWFSEADGGPHGTLFVFSPGYERLILKPGERPGESTAGRVRVAMHSGASVTGTLLKDGRPLVGATISIDRRPPGGELEEFFERAQTDSRGRFRFGSLGPGTYLLRIHRQLSRTGFSTAKPVATVTLARGEQRVLESAEGSGEDDRIIQLIEQLGDDRFPVREAALGELVRIGIPAVAALKAARTSPDLEVAARARRCLAEIDAEIEAKRAEHREKIDSKRAEHREKAQAAAERSDRAEATRRYRALLALPDPPLRDCRAACQFFETQRDWESLAVALEATAQEMKRVIGTPAKEFIRPAPPRDPAVIGGAPIGRGPIVLVQTELDGVWVNGKGTADGWIDWLTRKQNRMKGDRLDLAVKLGRLYWDRLGRPEKAVAAFEDAMYDVKFFTEPIEKVIARDWPIRPGKHKEIDGPAGSSYVNTLDELSEMQQRAGDLEGATETKTRQLLAHFILSWDHRQKVSNRSAFELASLLRRLPADAPLPPLPWLNVLGPENRVVELDLSKDGPLEAHDLNVLARPGYVFDSLEVTADVEWLGEGGRLDCYTVLQKHTVLGTLRWDRDKKKGREEFTEQFKVPPEVGLIRFQTQPWEIEGLQVHRITVKATLRPAAASRPAAKDAP
ncbi:MAG: carboxypeptidase regulatory-like domain-containing protein, partial [Planctomycetota bacterium]